MEPDTKSTVFMSSRHQNPGALVETAKSENFSVAAILGIVSLVFVVVAVVLEWMDWSVISRG